MRQVCRLLLRQDEEERAASCTISTILALLWMTLTASKSFETELEMGLYNMRAIITVPPIKLHNAYYSDIVLMMLC